jgi:hypothetical protein
MTTFRLWQDVGKRRFQPWLAPILAVLIGGGLIWQVMPSAVREARAEVYWRSGTAGADSAFLERLKGAPLKVLHAAPVNINGEGAIYVAMQSSKGVPELLSDLKERFLFNPDEPPQVGVGQPGGLLIAYSGGHACVMLLIRDHRANETMVLSLIAPRELFTKQSGQFGDVDGVDPVSELRPPHSQRVFGFQLGGVQYAVYKSSQSTLDAFYANRFEELDMRHVAIRPKVGMRSPDQGNLFFFDARGRGGFVAYQSHVSTNTSYAIVCLN